MNGCTEITDTGLKAISELPDLRELVLEDCFRWSCHNDLTDEGLFYLRTRATKLMTLDLGECISIGSKNGSGFTETACARFRDAHPDCAFDFGVYLDDY